MNMPKYRYIHITEIYINFTTRIKVPKNSRRPIFPEKIFIIFFKYYRPETKQNTMQMFINSSCSRNQWLIYRGDQRDCTKNAGKNAQNPKSSLGQGALPLRTPLGVIPPNPLLRRRAPRVVVTTSKPPRFSLQFTPMLRV